MSCQLDYIPQHLHRDDRAIVPIFSIGEKLFYRCKPENLEEPYDRISLYDISHNRNFNDDVQYPSDDVLYNIIAENNFERYQSHIITLIISNTNENGTYSKVMLSLDQKVKIEIILSHKPEQCMYPHSAFEIKIDNVLITPENYKDLLGKSNSAHKNIRSLIRLEMTSMLQRKIVDIDGDIEIIKEP